MKKLLAILMAITMVATLFNYTVAAAPETKDFNADYLNGTGQLAKPDSYYLYHQLDKNKGQPSNFGVYTKFPAEYYEICRDVEFYNNYNSNYDEFEASYGFDNMYLGCMFDYAFDDGIWLRENPAYADVLENGYNNTELTIETTISSFYPSDWFNIDLFYLYGHNDQNRAEEFDVMVPDEVLIDDGYGGFIFDLDNHTLKTRMCWYISYLVEDNSENGYHYEYIYSPWSDTVSIGKEGNTKEIYMPETLTNPTLSKFNVEYVPAPEPGYSNVWRVNYWFDVPEDVLMAQAYSNAVERHYTKVHYMIEYNVNGCGWYSLISNNVLNKSGSGSYDISSTYNMQYNVPNNVSPDDEVFIRYRLYDYYSFDRSIEDYTYFTDWAYAGTLPIKTEQFTEEGYDHLVYVGELGNDETFRYLDYGHCSGGTATCCDKAICNVCNKPYGELADHSFTALQDDATHHWYKCENCDAVTEKEAHYGGTPTETEKAVCEGCGKAYGETLKVETSVTEITESNEGNGYTITVTGSPSKIQFVNSIGATRTYSRDHALINVNSFDVDHNPTTDVENIAYEEWTINGNIPVENYSVLAKYGKNWDNSGFNFSLIKEPDTRFISAEATGEKIEKTITVKTGVDVIKIQLSEPERNYSATLNYGYVDSDGIRTWTFTRGFALGEHDMDILIKTKDGWTDGGKIQFESAK